MFRFNSGSFVSWCRILQQHATPESQLRRYIDKDSNSGQEWYLAATHNCFDGPAARQEEKRERGHSALRQGAKPPAPHYGEQTHESTGNGSGITVESTTILKRG